MRRRTALLVVSAASTLALAACGSDDDSDATVTSSVTPSPTANAATVEVALTDFAFGGLPHEIAAGTKLTVDNQSETELHELVAVRLDDGDERTVDDIVANGLEEVLTAGPPAAVLLQAPGGDPITAVGDGVLATPGRYLILCAIPTGADPGEYLAAAAGSDGPPDVAGGPPHFVSGMVDEVVVTP